MMKHGESDWRQRTGLLLGENNLEKLISAHVLVIGLGGVGGIAAEMICRAGVGEMTIVDGDVIEETNRNRQIPALCSTVGLKKADVMRERLLDINPEMRLTSIGEYLRDEKMTEVLSLARYTCVLDAIDTLSPKIHLALYCLENNLPLVSCMGSGARMNPELIRCVDIEKTNHCALARAVRQGLHKHGFTNGGYQAVYSPEAPVEGSVVDSGDFAGPNKRSTTGTISYMPALFGCHCAAAVIREICSK